MNMNSPTVKRLMREWKELVANPVTGILAQPLEENLFEWHFTIKGVDGTDFEGGRYHGKMSFPSEYPFKPPNVIMLTKSGRFETDKKICLNFSGFHPEQWQPSWTIQAMLVALRAFMETPANGAIGGIEVNEEQRKKLAKESIHYICPRCNVPLKDLVFPTEDETTKKKKKESTSTSTSTSPSTTIAVPTPSVEISPTEKDDTQVQENEEESEHEQNHNNDKDKDKDKDNNDNDHDNEKNLIPNEEEENEENQENNISTQQTVTFENELRKQIQMQQQWIRENQNPDSQRRQQQQERDVLEEEEEEEKEEGEEEDQLPIQMDFSRLEENIGMNHHNRQPLQQQQQQQGNGLLVGGGVAGANANRNSINNSTNNPSSSSSSHPPTGEKRKIVKIEEAKRTNKDIVLDCLSVLFILLLVAILLKKFSAHVVNQL